MAQLSSGSWDLSVLFTSPKDERIKTILEDTEKIWLMRYGNDHILDANVTEWGRAGSEYDIRNNKMLRALQRQACRIYKPKTLQFEWKQVL